MFLAKGADAASSYAAGYLLEMSLSVDNFCAFLLLFRVFNVRLHVAVTFVKKDSRLVANKLNRGGYYTGGSASPGPRAALGNHRSGHLPSGFHR